MSDLKFNIISEDSGEPYTLNFKSVTCNCMNFKHVCSKFNKDDHRRCCKHFKQFFRNSPEKIAEILKGGGTMSLEYIPLEYVHLHNPKQDAKRPVLFSRALEVMEYRLQPIVDDLVLALELDRFNYCGSFRRWMDNDDVPPGTMIGDLDFIYLGTTSVAKIVELIEPEEILANGPQKAMLVVSGVRVDVRKIESMDKYVFALLRATGSKAENIRLSRVANSIGYSLSEYGLLHCETAKRPDKIFNTEQNIYDFLGEPYRHPRERNPELVVKYNNPIYDGEIVKKDKPIKNKDAKLEITPIEKSFYY